MRVCDPNHQRPCYIDGHSTVSLQTNEEAPGSDCPCLCNPASRKCAKGVFFNWAQYLCDEFLANFRESQEHRTSFFFSWLLFLITLVAWDKPEESVILELPAGMCEGARYAHLWDSKDKQRIEDNKVFWVLFQSSVATAINSCPRLSPTIYDKYKHIATFQITMH